VIVPELDPITGRYVYVEIADVRNRIYFEESGQGRPLVCLHTAGADSRQYRHLLCDAEVTSRWRVVAFDLPYHGRSLPPERWWEEEYLLTRDAYVETIMAFLEALGLERPVVLGCSMGGAVVLELARRYASAITAVIGLEAASKIEGRFLDWTVMPDVDGSVVAASWTYGLNAPQSPEAARREIWWIYSQAGPGVYRAGTYFYSVDWDLRGREGEIDTSRCPVYLLTGEYDHACSPEETFATADAIAGASSAKMEDIGHFPMAENYPHFREYLLPVLRELEKAASA
jgi:pimeloyl-ACP methyl ester carboxylesterase